MAKAKKTIDQKIDHLAILVQRGFESVDKRFEEVNKRFDSLERAYQVVIDRLDSLDTQVADLRSTTNSLVRMVAARDREMRDFDLRLKKIERRLGLAH